MTPTLDEQIEWVETLRRPNGYMNLAAMVDATLATLRSVKQAEPVAAQDGWMLRRSDVNEVQADSINRLIARAKHAHYTNAVLRINGMDEHHEADWIKHLAAAPAAPQSPGREG